MDGQKELWQAVILQMLSDSTIIIKPKEEILKFGIGCVAHQNNNLRIRSEAMKWLKDDDGRGSVRFVCELAGISYTAFYKKYIIFHKGNMDDEKIRSDIANCRNRIINKRINK